jgi:CBS domain-containing protein
MRKVRDLMTPSPHTIGEEQVVSEASRRMHEFGVRHLPVLSGSVLVGLLSDRDVRLVEAVGTQAGRQFKVADVMMPEPYVVDGTTDLAVVARAMAERKIGSAIVTEHGKIAGIFTATDALHALANRLENE